MQFSDGEKSHKPQIIRIPGHSFNLQYAEREDIPVHGLPPFLGRGLVQLLCLTLVPVPHELLHWLKTPQFVHPPCTMMYKNMNNNIRLLKIIPLNILTFAAYLNGT